MSMKRSRRKSSECESTTTCSLANLPKELLTDIFSRLSIKSIIISRCVSKTWYNLLSSSNTNFTKLHFTKSHLQFIVQPPTGCFSVVELDDDIDLDNNSIKPIPSRFRLPDYNLVAINSCNGFVCLARFRKHYSPVKICNPITGEYLNLPKHNYFERNVVSGFGFCAKTNQYKVVRLVRRKGSSNDRVVEVYTIGTKSWRTIGTAPKYPSTAYSTTFLNGKIHWFCHDLGCSDFIITFDLETEKFGNVPPPAHFSEESIRGRGLLIMIGVVGEFLCLSYYRESWVMKEYGFWTKVCVDMLDNFSHHQAIKYLSGGKLLMNYDDGELVCYDPVKEISKKFEVIQFPSSFETIAYIPSFMSFNDAMMGDKGAKLRTGICRVQRKRRKESSLYADRR